MGRISMTRVVLGGLLAGLIINVGEVLLNSVVMADEVNAAVERMNLPPVAAGAIAIFVVLGFLLGIAAVWLYAAIRPRYGAGPKTALCAGAAVWFFASLYPGLIMATLQMYPTGVMFVGLGWALVELLVATLAGAWLYREEVAVPGPSPAA